MTLHTFAPVQHTFAPVQLLQRLPLCIRPLGAGVRLLLTLALALGTVACGPETTPENGDGDGNGGGTPDIAVVAGVTDVMPMGFTLTLQPGVPDIMPKDLTLKPTVAIATATANTGEMPNTRYAVKTAALLALNQKYTLTIAKTGYSIQASSFTRSTASSEATIQKMILTVEGLQVEGTINGTDIAFPYGTIGTSSGTSTLTGTVSLELSAGAAVDGTNPADGTPQTYNSGQSQSITVLAEDGTTKQTYTVTTQAYEKDTNPYGVYSEAQLHAVRDELTESYRLMQDLTLPNAGDDCSKPSWAQAQDNYCTNGWKPIGTYTTRMNTNSHFTGTFDGNGHSINNLFIQRDTNYVGLFGYVGRDGTIRNLGVHTAAAGVTGGSQVGGLVGKNEGTITNCYATGAVTGSDHDVTRSDHDNTSSGHYVGGLAGENEGGGTITDCYATAAVTGGDYVGGLVGWNAYGTITNSYATGAVTGINRVGGLAGRHVNGSITNCYATGAVTGSGRFVGGLVGTMHNETAITNSYATGAVSGSDDVGGLVGTSSSSSATITDCYATGAVSGGTSNVGGLVGTNFGTVSNSYYPAGRPAGMEGTTGEALNSGVGQAHFSGFAFAGDTPDWKWVEGKWPQSNGFEAAQATPSLLTYHTATVTEDSVSTTAFTMTLAPPLSGLTKDDWALYKVTSRSSDAVPLTSVTDTGNGGGYTFTTTTAMAADSTYHLLYTKADVIVVPSSAGHISVAVPGS